MEEEDEVAIACSTSWIAVEGCLERSVCISCDDVRTPGPTSRLVLVPPSRESGPCELTVSFQRRLCHVRQIYVLSTARSVEIYGQSEQDSEAEYVSTMRGELVSFPDDDISRNGRGDDQRRFLDSSGSARCQTAAVASHEEIESKILQGDAENDISVKIETGEFVGEWKEQSLTSSGSSWGRSRDSEESFQSLSDDVPGKIVERSIIFDEPLDQTDWVECPHSPMKSSALSSDDEVDINKCGFFLVDSDGDKQDGQHARSELSTGDEEAGGEKGDAACECSSGTGQEKWLQAQFAEARSQPPTTLSNQAVKESAGQSDIFPELRDVPDVQSPGNHCGIPHQNDLEASRRVRLTGIEDGTGEVPVYEAEMSLGSLDHWKSVKIRLLSLKDKSKLVLHKVIINLVPGPSASPMAPRPSPFGSFQQSAGSTSLLAMLGPGIFQIARGLADSRTVNSLRVMSSEKKLPDSKVSPSPDLTNASLSALGSELSSMQTTESCTVTSSSTGSVGQRDETPLGEEKATSPVAKEINPCVSHSLQDEPCRRGNGSGRDSGVPVVQNGESPLEFDQSQVIESQDIKSVQNEKVEDVGRGKGHDLSGEVVQRLDRLEAICLRMENSLNFALENMDKRLKLLEAGGMGRMAVAGQPFWGASYESGPFVSASSVNLPPVQTGMKKGAVFDKQTYSCSSAMGDSPTGKISEKGIASRTDPFYPGLLSSTSPSLLSSVSPALPLWPLSTPNHVLSESNSRASNTTAHSNDGDVDQLMGSCHGQAAPVAAEETYLEAQTSSENGSEMSSDSEHTSFADNSEEPDPSSCTESVSSSPSRAAQRMENALTSALSAFSAPFDVAMVNSSKQKDFFQVEEEDNTEEESFTSEEHAPLVDIECLSLGEKDGSAQTNTEEVFMQGYESIPVSVKKKSCDMTLGGLNLEEVFWVSEVEGADRGSQTNGQGGLLQSPDEKIFSYEVSDGRMGKNSTVSKATPNVTLDTSSVLCMDDLTTYDLFPSDFERVLRGEPLTEAKGGERSEAFEHDKLPNPFLQLAFAGDGDIRAREGANQLESGDNITVTYMSVRGFSKPLDSHKEMLLQEEMFPEDWNWFTSEVGTSSNEGVLQGRVVGSGYLDPGGNMATIVDPCKAENDIPELSVGYSEPRSLLDEDSTIAGSNSQFRVDIYSNDWGVQKTQWSLLDEDPPIVDFRFEEGHPDDWLRQRDQRSLLDEDIFIAPRESSTGEREGSLSSPEDQYDLSGVMRPPKCTDTLRSPSSHTSRSNPFEDDCNEMSDLKLESPNYPTRDLLEDFGEAHELEAPESERTQSLLFHLSL